MFGTPNSVALRLKNILLFEYIFAAITSLTSSETLKDLIEASQQPTLSL
jgi:hypothetical protein